MNWDILTRALHNTISDQERQMLDTWLEASERHQNLWEQMVRQKADLDRLTDEDEKELQWLLLQEKLPTAPIVQMTSVATSGRKKGRYTGKQFTGESHAAGEASDRVSAGAGKRRLFIAAACAAVLSALLYTAVRVRQIYKDRETAAAQMLVVRASGATPAKVQLPDGSLVWLHYQSSIRYDSSKYVRGDRTIELNGDAFFDIARRPDAPFVVHSGSVRVQVLGTSFGIHAREKEKSQVAVATGRVAVSIGGRQQRLEGGQALSYDPAAGQLFLRAISVEEASALREQRLYFNNDSLVSIAGKLEDWYHRRVKVNMSGMPGTDSNGNDIKHTRQKTVSFTGVIQDEGMEKVLNGLGYLASFSWSIDHDTINISPQP